MKLDYGSGRKALKGYKTSDFTGSPAYDYMIKDYIIDELGDESVCSLHCRNVIHHIRPTELYLLFEEFDRLLKVGGELIISEPKEEYFIQNKILDIIWYRYLYYDHSIYLPTHYVNFKRYMKENYRLVRETTDNKNEVLVYKKVRGG